MENKEYEIQILGDELIPIVQTIKVDEAQRQIIEYFANVRKTSELQNVYKINDCEFKIVPYLRINPQVM